MCNCDVFESVAYRRDKHGWKCLPKVTDKFYTNPPENLQIIFENKKSRDGLYTEGLVQSIKG